MNYVRCILLYPDNLQQRSNEQRCHYNLVLEAYFFLGHCLKIVHYRDAWVAPSVKRLTLAQVMISRLVGSSPTSGSLLSAQNPLGILCPPLSLPLSPVHTLFLSKRKSKNKNKNRVSLRPPDEVGI